MQPLESQRINKHSHISIYVQLKQILRQMILEKHFKPDQKIPSENELSQIFNISRMTVRHAIKELTDEGYLYIKRGEGTFVYKAEKIQKLIKLEGFSREMMRLGFKPSCQVLQAEEVTDYDKHREAFYGLEKDKDQPIILIKRVLYLDATPYAVESSFLDYRTGEGLLDREFSAEFSIYRYIEDECGTYLAQANHVIEPALADKTHAALLEIKKGDPILRINGLSYTGDGRPIEYLDGVYRGAKYQLHIEIKK